MKYLAGVILIFFYFSLYVYGQKGMEFFKGDWDELIEEAQNSNKPIFVDAYASWCGPCKYMAKNVFTDQGVGEFYNKHFICYKMDMEKGKGKDIAKKYAVRVYPTYLYLDKNGSVMHVAVGGMKPERFISTAEKSMDPKRSLSGLRNQYMNGNKSDSLLLEYAKMLKSAYMDHSTIANELLEKQKESDLLKPIIWDAIRLFVEDMESNEFSYLVNNREKYSEKYGEKEVTKKIAMVFQQSAYNIARSGKTDKFAKLKQRITEFNLEDEKKMLGDCELLYYKTTRDWSNFCMAASAYLDSVQINDEEAISDFSATICNRCDDRVLLEKVKKLIESALVDNRSFELLNSYSIVLYKLSLEDEALDAAEEAVKIAKSNNIDCRETERLIQRIKSPDF